MKRYNFCYIAFFILIFVLQSCATKPPENPDNICLIFKEKRSWYKAAIKSEKRWKIPPYVLMSFVYQESSFRSDARPEREKILGVIPWLRTSTAVGYSQALSKTWDDYKDELQSSVADLKNLGGPESGHITAGKFLEHFVDYSWIHLDIAGVAFLQKNHHYNKQGGTGVAVRLLTHFIAQGNEG